MATEPKLCGYVVRGGDGNRTAVIGYAWPDNLVRGDELVVKRFDPTPDGRKRAWLVAVAIGGTVKRVVKRAKNTTATTGTTSARPRGDETP